MGTYKVEHSEEIPASAETVYNILIDYNVGHPAIVPPRFFEKITVLEGGVGDGTVFRLDSNIFGNKQSATMRVYEVEKGRKLIEKDEENGLETVFTVDPISAESCQLSLTTSGKTAAGLRGTIEKWLTPLILRHIYRKEMQLLREYVQ